MPGAVEEVWGHPDLPELNGLRGEVVGLHKQGVEVKLGDSRGRRTLPANSLRRPDQLSDQGTNLQVEPGQGIMMLLCCANSFVCLIQCSGYLYCFF